MRGRPAAFAPAAIVKLLSPVPAVSPPRSAQPPVGTPPVGSALGVVDVVLVAAVAADGARRGAGVLAHLGEHGLHVGLAVVVGEDRAVQVTRRPGGSEVVGGRRDRVAWVVA